MFRRISTFGITLFLTGAALVTAPNLAQAQRGGGGRGGGAHYGGSSFGGYRGGYSGGYRNYGYGGCRNYGYGGYRNYGYNGYRYGYRGFSPFSYGGYGFYSPYYSGAYSYPSYSVTPDYVGGTYVAPSTGNYQSMYPPNPTSLVTINVPADAKVWFGDTPTTSTGAVRQFTTPPLTPGTQYAYEIRAQWTENGKEVTQSQKVNFDPGSPVIVNFPVAAATAAETVPVPPKP